MDIIIIAAVSRNMVIGKDNDLVWHLPADMAFFKKSTAGAAVLMGRRNYYSIPEKYRPLPKRRNIIITRQENLHINEDVIIKNSVEEGVEWAKENGEDQLYIIGGGQIYDYCIKHDIASEMYLTWIEEEFKGDTFFPEFDSSTWEQNTIFRNKADDENPYDFRIVHYSKQLEEKQLADSKESNKGE
jgi:dihydrofolate reductase